MKHMKLLLSLLLVIALTAATAMIFGSCDKKNDGDSSVTEALREEAITITVTVTDDKGENTVFTIETRHWYLRGALEQENLVQGDESEYGLFVTTVDGEGTDSDKQEWWCFTKGGEMMMTGVDDTLIADGDHYEIVFTVGW